MGVVFFTKKKKVLIMSWQAYVDDQLLGSKQVTKAIIIGNADGAKWAANGLELQGDEAAKLIAGFSDPTSLLASGLYIGGVKYMTIRADDNSVYGKKGQEGIVCAKTNQAIVIGHYNDQIQPGQCTLVVEKLADYLRGVNY